MAGRAQGLMVVPLPPGLTEVLGAVVPLPLGLLLGGHPAPAPQGQPCSVFTCLCSREISFEERNLRLKMVLETHTHSVPWAAGCSLH